MYASDMGDRERHGNRRPDVDSLCRARHQREWQERVAVDLSGEDPVVPGSLSGRSRGGGRLQPTQRGVDQHQDVCERPRAMTSARRSATLLAPNCHFSAM